jgi:N-acetylmuramoyl-L-alanine amidase
LQVTQVTVERSNGRTSQAAIESSGPATYRDFSLISPLRVVVDIADADVKAQAPSIPADDPLLKSIRVGQFAPDTVRVVFDLKEPAGYFIRRRSHPDRLLIEFRKGDLVGKVVVVDAGHGGKDPGTAGYKAGLREKDMVLDIARRVAELLHEAGLSPMMTRAEDRFVELADRVIYANSRRADLFVSIHCNAMPTAKFGTRCGVEVYYYTPQSELLADVMQGAVVKAEGRPSNGVRRRGFYVIHHTVMPSVLVEVGYLDHAIEGELLSTPDFRQKVAQGIVDGIRQYLQSRPGTLG